MLSTVLGKATEAPAAETPAFVVSIDAAAASWIGGSIALELKVTAPAEVVKVPPNRIGLLVALLVRLIGAAEPPAVEIKFPELLELIAGPVPAAVPEMVRIPAPVQLTVPCWIKQPIPPAEIVLPYPVSPMLPAALIVGPVLVLTTVK